MSPPIAPAVSSQPVLNLRTVADGNPRQGLAKNLVAVKEAKCRADTATVAHDSSKTTFGAFKKIFSKASSKDTRSTGKPTPIPKSQIFRLNGVSYHIPGYTPRQDSDNKLALKASSASARIVGSDGELKPLSAHKVSEPAKAVIATVNAPHRAALSKNYKIFCTLYATDNGSSAINAIYRGEPAANSKIVVEKAMEEMWQRLGDQTQSMKKENPDIKERMKFLLSELPASAAEIYDRAKLPAEASLIYRGQGMTLGGIAKLKELCGTGTPVQATHFLSCSTNRVVADIFSKRASTDPAIKQQTKSETPVLFKILGFSQSALKPLISYDNESVIFSPHAQFHIENMKLENKITGRIIVELKEIRPEKHAVPFPY